jgi:putative ABC transport system permease protein
MIAQILQDLRHGLRLLARNPGFSIVAVFTLALGIGANTAIFSLVNGLMLKPLPYHDADRIVVPATIFANLRSDRGSNAFADILDWKAQTDLFTAVAAYSDGSFVITGGDEPQRIAGLFVGDGYFQAIGATPLIGRTFSAQEYLPNQGRVVVISHGLWMRRFGGDPKVVNSTIELSGVPHVIAGVMPKDSTFPADAEIIRPNGFGGTPPAWAMRRDNHVFQSVARLRPGVSISQAQARLTAMAARVAREATHRQGTSWKLHSLRDWIVGPIIQRTLLVLLGSVLFVLLIACANVANLLLVRGAAREREVAIRGALGAGWRRLTGQFLAESALLTLAGAVAGIALGYAGLRALIHFAPPDIPRVGDVQIDMTVLVFTTALCVVTAIAFGLIPAIKAHGIAPVDAFREGGRSQSGGVRGGRLRNVLVVCELALSIVLLAGAGLLVRSFSQLQHVNPGFPTHNLLTMEIALPRARYAGPPQIATAYQQITDGIRRIPGVVSAAATSSLPVGGGGGHLGRVFLSEGQPDPPASKDTFAQWNVIQPEYFRTMGIPVTAGRAFNEHDTIGSPLVIVISESMAKEKFPNQNALGKRIRSWRDENKYREIVGVVGDLHYNGLAEDPVNLVYVPHTQDSWNGLLLAIRTQGDPQTLVRSIRSEIWSHDAKLAIADIKTMDAIVDQELARPRFSMFLLGLFALTALVLAAIGIYGVIAYSVAQRTREIGIRMALGANRGDVLRMIWRRGVALAGAGVGCGVAGALALTRLMNSLLFGVSPADPGTFVGVCAALVVVTLAACYIPARRATTVEPVEALRYE